MTSDQVHCYSIAKACLLLFTCFGVIACGSGGSQAESERVSTSDHRPTFTVSPRDMGAIESNPDIRMRDVGFSAVIDDRSVWVFGDTFLAYPNENDNPFLTNSKSSTLDRDAGDGLFGFEEDLDDVGAVSQFIPFTTEENAFNDAHKGQYCIQDPCKARWAIWPASIVVDNEKGLAYFFYGKIYAEEGWFNFHGKGRSIAVQRFREESAPRRIVFDEVENFPTLMFSEEEPKFGSATVEVERMVYVYGCSLDRDTLTKPCHLARVPIERILDKASWTYYQSSGTWSADADGMRSVFDGNNMMSVFFNSYLGSYVAIYTEPLKDHIMLRVAARPEGPWSSPRRVWTAPKPKPKGWIYDALAHPEFSIHDQRRIYVTYTLPVNEFESKLMLLELTVSLTP